MSSEAVEVVAHKPHAVCVPGPTQSHIKAMLKLAKLLHHKGFYITFVNTQFNHKRFLRARGPDCLNGLPDFRFEQIQDSLLQSDADATQEITSLINSIMKFMIIPFSNLIVQLNNTAVESSNIVPPVSCIVSDVFMPFTTKAAQDFGIPLLPFAPIAACAFMGFYQFRSLLEKGLAPLPDESSLTNGYLDTKIDWIPGTKDLRLKDLPSFFRTTDRNDVMFNFTLDSVEIACKATAILIDTFDALEANVLNALSHVTTHFYAVGPLELLLKQIPDDQNKLKSIGYNLWKEESECLQWLDSKDPNSVIYVNFGSIIVMKAQQLVEFCWGLADSKCNFLWIIRPDLVADSDAAALPLEFVAETKERGLMAGWCPQEQVLNHPSIGGFLTHCGWYSTIESLLAGVPMLCCPFLTDQPTNCRYTCKEWEVGMELDSCAKRDEVESLVRELMEGKKGKKLRNKALEWKKLAEDATGPCGSSSLNLDKFVNMLLELIK